MSFLEEMKQSFDKRVMEEERSVKNNKLNTQASQIKQFIALTIDFSILMIIRLAIMMSVSPLVNRYRIKFFEEFGLFAGSISNFNISKSSHRVFFYQSEFGESVMGLLIIFIALGIAYNILMLSTPKRATIGQRITGIFLVSYSENPINTFRIVIRVFLNYFSWCLPLIGIMLWGTNKVISVAVIFFSCFWYDTSLISGKKLSIHDMITKTMLKNGRVDI